MPATTPPVERMLSPRDAAGLLGVSTRHLRRLVRSGELRPTYRVSHRVVRIPESAVSRLLKHARA